MTKNQEGRESREMMMISSKQADDFLPTIFANDRWCLSEIVAQINMGSVANCLVPLDFAQMTIDGKSKIRNKSDQCYI